MDLCTQRGIVIGLMAFSDAFRPNVHLSSKMSTLFQQFEFVPVEPIMTPNDQI